MASVQDSGQYVVYLVDDDPLITESLGTALDLETPWRVVRSNDPAAALAQMDTLAPDVVLSDFKMPHMDGLEFLRAVRGRHPRAVLMLLTGYSDKESAIAAINDLGLWQYVEKPWSLDDLLVKVAQGLERRELQSSLAARNRELEARVRQLESAQERLLRSEQLVTVGRVISGLAHELGNQLSVVAYAELLSEKLTDPELRRQADTIAQTLRRIEALVQEVKDFVRGAQTPYRREPADIAALVDEALAVLRYDRKLQRRPLHLIIEARPIGLVHRGRLAQLVINLVKNALEASPSSSDVHVTVGEFEGRGRITIRDSGPGFVEAVLAQLGQPFFSTKESGMGLGVGISRRIIEEHGGTLSFANHSDGGAIVSVEMPLHVESDT